MKQKVIILSIAAVVLLAGASWVFLAPHFYKHGAVTSMVLDNQELLSQAVLEMDKLATDKDVLVAVRGTAQAADPDQVFAFAYLSRTDRDAAALDVDNWRELTDEQLAARYGVGVADKLIQIKDFDGLYACFTYYDGETTKSCCIPVENQTLDQVFDETDVKQIYPAADRLWFKCYEKFKTADVESADFFYMKSGQPKPPSGNYATTETTKNGWLYKSKYSMCYLEKITGQFYYIDQDGHDPV